MDKKFSKDVDETIDFRTPKQKFFEGVEKVKDGAKKAGIWAIHHPVETTAAVVAVTAAVRQGRLAIEHGRAAKKAAEDRLTVYCGDVAGRAHLKHELNYNELKELRDRMSKGQTRFEALDDMGLLR